PKWLQSDALLAHARLFFDDFVPPNGAGADHTVESVIAAELKDADQPLRDYFCYVLLDFAAAERCLEDLPLSAALVLARRLDVDPRFSEFATKELGLSKKQFAKIDASAERRVSEAGVQTT